MIKKNKIKNNGRDKIINKNFKTFELPFFISSFAGIKYSNDLFTFDVKHIYTYTFFF